MPTGPARSGRPDDRLRAVEGACSEEVRLTGDLRAVIGIIGIAPIDLKRVDPSKPAWRAV